MNTHNAINEVTPFTAEEMQATFVKYLLQISNYWDKIALEESSIDSKPNWLRSIDGFLHSFYVASGGFSGGFPIDFNIEVSLRNSGLPAKDINNGSLKDSYRFTIDKFREELTELEKSSNIKENEKYRLLWHIKIAEMVKTVDNLDIPFGKKTAHFINNFLDFVEQGDGTFGPTSFVLEPDPEDRSYYIDLGERYYDDGTTFTGLTPSLGDLYRDIISRSSS